MPNPVFPQSRPAVGADLLAALAPDPQRGFWARLQGAAGALGRLDRDRVGVGRRDRGDDPRRHLAGAEGAAHQGGARRGARAGGRTHPRFPGGYERRCSARLARSDPRHRAEDERRRALVLDAADAGSAGGQSPSPRCPAHGADRCQGRCRAEPRGAAGTASRRLVGTEALRQSRGADAARPARLLPSLPGLRTLRAARHLPDGSGKGGRGLTPYPVARVSLSHVQ
nr:hypothetical protein [Methylorubrum sp. Q1]